MKTKLFYLLIMLTVISLIACGSNKDKEPIDEDELGFISADVESEETNLKVKARYRDNTPGSSNKIERAFENAPPMIPHTTEGFLPVTAKNNICLSCHLPEKAKEVNSVPLPKTHFTELRPKLIEKDGIFEMANADKLYAKDLKDFNFSYFNCTQCHVPQTTVTVDIKNLFTPEFRNKLGTQQSDLRKRIDEGIK